jgi:hypothetical protein
MLAGMTLLLYPFRTVIGIFKLLAVLLAICICMHLNGGDCLLRVVTLGVVR